MSWDWEGTRHLRGTRQPPHDLSSSTPRRTYGTYGLLLGLLSLLLFWVPMLSWIPAVGGIVSSARGLSRSTRGDSNKVPARWGLALSILGLVIATIMAIVILLTRNRFDDWHWGL